MAIKNISKIAIMALTIASIVLVTSTFGAITATQTLSSSGTIATSANIGVYSDSSCTTSLTSLAWGAANPGETVTRTIYVKNTGSGVSLTLGMTTTNWSPTNANGPITITWDKEGTVLTPGQSVTAVITLRVSSSITGISTYSVQVNILGSS